MYKTTLYTLTGSLANYDLVKAFCSFLLYSLGVDSRKSKYVANDWARQV